MLRRLYGILPANLLYLVSIVLGVAVAYPLQKSLSWLGLILGNLISFLLPALFFASPAPFEMLRLRWPGWRLCLLAMVIGVGHIPISLMVSSLATWIFGYDFSPAGDLTPRAVGGLLTLGFAVVAVGPVCEEMLFRGYILAAFENAGLPPRSIVLSVAVLFTAWHMSAVRAPGVMVSAVVFTYIAWRTGSVWPSLAAHVANNASAVVMLLVKHVVSPKPLLVATIGVIAVAGSVFSLWRIIRESPDISARNGTWRAIMLVHWWPLVVAGAIVGGVSIAEVLSRG